MHKLVCYVPIISIFCIITIFSKNSSIHPVLHAFSSDTPFYLETEITSTKLNISLRETVFSLETDKNNGSVQININNHNIQNDKPSILKNIPLANTFRLIPSINYQIQLTSDQVAVLNNSDECFINFNYYNEVGLFINIIRVFFYVDGLYIGINNNWDPILETYISASSFSKYRRTSRNKKLLLEGGRDILRKIKRKKQIKTKGRVSQHMENLNNIRNPMLLPVSKCIEVQTKCENYEVPISNLEEIESEDYDHMEENCSVWDKMTQTPNRVEKNDTIERNSCRLYLKKSESAKKAAFFIFLIVGGIIIFVLSLLMCIYALLDFPDTGTGKDV